MQIDRNFCDGYKWGTHAAHGEGDAGAGKSPLIRGTKAMRDVADDLATILAGLAVPATPIVPATADPVPKADYDVLVAQVNAMTVAMNALVAATLLTTKVG